VGALIYHEPLDWLVLAGGGVMFTGNLVNIRAEEKRNKRIGDAEITTKR
jgi:drug/metabolite transporter (DMT)-like permease